MWREPHNPAIITGPAAPRRLTADLIFNLEERSRLTGDRESRRRNRTPPQAEAKLDDRARCTGTRLKGEPPTLKGERRPIMVLEASRTFFSRRGDDPVEWSHLICDTAGLGIIRRWLEAFRIWTEERDHPPHS